MGKKNKNRLGDFLQLATSAAEIATAFSSIQRSTTKSFEEGVKTNLPAAEGGASPTLKASTSNDNDRSPLVTKVKRRDYGY